MENVADVLKMFFAVTVFAIAITVFFRMTALAKDTADAIFTAIDKTTYMDYNSYDIDGANRKVKFQEIIPTIYRYAQEAYGVTIIDGGQIIARFDLDTESQVSSCIWSDERNARASQDEKIKSETIKKEIKDYLNKYIVAKVGGSEITNIDALMKRIYATGNVKEPVYTSWLNSNTYQNNNISQRILYDLYGGQTFFSLINPGVTELNSANRAGQHLAVCNGRGLWSQYKDLTFTEYIVQLDRNEYIQDEDGENTGLLLYGTIRYTKKREIIYVKN